MNIHKDKQLDFTENVKYVIIKMVISMKNNTEQKIKELIEKIRLYIINDGGDLKFIKYDKNIVYVKLTGACETCPMMDITLKNGIEELLKNEIPEIKEVKNIL